MPSQATINLIGHLGRNPELSYTASGLAIARCSVAVNSGYGDREVTTWYSLTLFGKKAELFNEWARSGQAVSIVGEFYQDSYTTQAGEKRDKLQVDVYDFKLITPPIGVDDTAPSNDNDNDSDDIPF